MSRSGQLTRAALCGLFFLAQTQLGTAEPAKTDEGVPTNTTITITNTTTANGKPSTPENTPHGDPKVGPILMQNWRLHHLIEPGNVETLLKAQFPAESDGDKTDRKSPIIKKYDQGITVFGTDEEIRKVLFFVATRVDVPPAQVRLTNWTIQVNANRDDYEDTQDRLDTIQAGMELARVYNHRIQEALQRVARRVGPDNPAKLSPEEKAKAPAHLLELLSQLGFPQEKRRPLSLFETFLIVLISPRSQLKAAIEAEQATLDTNFFAPCQKMLTDRYNNESTLERDRKKAKKLLELLAIWQRDFRLGFMTQIYPIEGDRSVTIGTSSNSITFDSYESYALAEMANAYVLARDGNPKPDGSKKREAPPRSDMKPSFKGLIYEQIQTQAQSFVPHSEYDSKDPSKGPERGYPQALQQKLMVTDSLVRTVCEEYSAQMKQMLWNPYVGWARDICANSDQLDVFGETELTVDSGETGYGNITAQNYHPFVLRRKEDGSVENESKAVIEALASGTNVYPALAGPLFAVPPAPTYVSVTPGLNLTVLPKMRPGGAEAHLDIDLVNSTEAEVSEALQKRELAPVSFVKSSHHKTKVWVKTYDMFQLSTMNIQTTRQGDNAWAIPILRDLPLVGYLFKGPKVPYVRSQGVLVLTQALVIPRTIDLMPDL